MKQYMYNNNVAGKIIMRRSSEFAAFSPACYVEVFFVAHKNVVFISERIK